ncbi:hypothetical protein FRX31_016921 [Thalictrum thalictroides]|uniref:Uncharacterized protein n=1 Tax=Thalictrum thalictroides TaxID=46969 RepID=A0A7J6W7X2_THATH|nr:hypothetical protein FRX31_016921 [Thalictrum thalictroides]
MHLTDFVIEDSFLRYLLGWISKVSYIAELTCILYHCGICAMTLEAKVSEDAKLEDQNVSLFLVLSVFPFICPCSYFQRMQSLKTQIFSVHIFSCVSMLACNSV